MAAPVEKPDPRAGNRLESHPKAEASTVGVILDDLVCRICGYNLRGLAENGHCPECDTPINRSLRGDLLRFSDPRWVQTVARGFRVLNFAVVMGLVAITALAIWGRMLGMPWLTTAAALLVGAVAISGVWQATAREPAMTDHEPLHSTRRLLRALTVSAIMMMAAGDFLTLSFPQGRAMAHLLAAAILISGFLCGFRYAASLARRMPDPLLLAQTRGVMWGVITSYTLFLGLSAMAISSVRLPSPLAMAFGLSCTVLIACVMFTLWCLTLIARYAAALHDAAFEAQATWLASADATETAG